MTLERLAGDLAAGKTTSRALVTACLERISVAEVELHPAFLFVDRKGAIAAAEEIDQLGSAGGAPSAYAGIPISIKDLFDIRGQVTAAGSMVLAGMPPASVDAEVVARLRRAGFVFVGRTNMTEFAFSGLGLNPHFGTPLSQWDRPGQRIAGGSTSGGAVSVAQGMAHAALGTDTGGSCRIPAAWCGLTGFKPTTRSVSNIGVFALSSTLDSVGVIARSVGCCRIVYNVSCADDGVAEEAVDVASLTFLAPTNLVLDNMDPAVERAWVRALEWLEGAGARIERRPLAGIDDIPAINAKGGFAAAESWAAHRARILDGGGDAYDQRVLRRIRRGAEQDAAGYIELCHARQRLIALVAWDAARFDAILMPTTPIVPPRLSDLASDAEFDRVNLLALRNPSVINMIDGCSLTLPMHPTGEAPAGMMISGLAGTDAHLLNVAAAVEILFQTKLSAPNLTADSDGRHESFQDCS